MNLNGVKYKEKSLKILKPKPKKNRRNFEEILYLEKAPIPLSCEIFNKTRIVSELAKNIERIFYNNDDYYFQKNELKKNENNSKEKSKKNLLKRNSIKTSLLTKDFKKKNLFYLNKIMSKKISKSRNYNFPSPNEIRKENGINLILKKDKKISLKKINSSLINKKENKNIINRNLALDLSNLTELNLTKTSFQNKKIMKKAISSNILNDITRIEPLNKLNFNNNSKLNLISSKIKKAKEAKRNILFNHLKPCESNMTFTSYISSYTDRYSKSNSKRSNHRKLTNDLILNQYKDINNLSSSKTNIYNNYNKIFSEEDDQAKQYNVSKNTHNFSNSLSKINKIKIGNLNNLKENANNFTNLFFNEIKSLNNMVHNRNKKLLELIDINNHIINTTKEINMKKNEKLDEELDIRKDLIDKREKIYTENGIKENLINRDNNNYIIIPTKEDLIKSFNLLKKNINKIPVADALDIIEKCVDKEQREKLDVEQLLNDYNNHKIKKELLRIVETRKKAEKNYKKMLKLKYNL